MDMVARKPCGSVRGREQKRPPGYPGPSSEDLRACTGEGWLAGPKGEEVPPASLLFFRANPPAASLSRQIFRIWQPIWLAVTTDLPTSSPASESNEHVVVRTRFENRTSSFFTGVDDKICLKFTFFIVVFMLRVQRQT